MSREPSGTDPEEPVRLGKIAGSLGFLLRMAQLDAFARASESFAEVSIRPGEFGVLCVVGENPGARQGSIAEVLKIKPAHMTKLVQRMAKSGYIRRAVHPEDRRSVRLTLTADGEKFVDETCERLIEVHRTDTPLKGSDYETLVDLLRKLTGVSAP